MATKQANPWSVKGIEADTRETAKEAARRAGMTVGQWLNSVIQKSASDLGEAREKVRRQRSGGQDEREAVLDNQIEDLENRLGQMAQNLRSVQSLSMLHPQRYDQHERGAGLFGPQAAVVDRLETDVYDLADAVQALTRRFDKSEEESRSVWSAVEARLGSIDAKFDRFAENRSVAPLDEAVTEIAADPMPVAPPDFETQRAMLEQIGTMRRRLDDYGDAPAEQATPAEPEAGSPTLTATLSKLADRLDALQEHISNPPPPRSVDDGALDAIDAKIARMEADFRTSLDNLDPDSLARRIVDGNAEATSAALRQHAEAMARPAAEFMDLQEALDDIAARQTALETTVAGDRSVDFDTRFDALASKLDEALSSHNPDLKEIRSSIADLARIITEFAKAPRSDVERLVDRFDALETRVAETLARREGVQPEIARRLDEINARVGEPDPRIDDVQHKLDRIGAGLGKPDPRLDDMQRRLDAVAAKIDRGVTAHVPEIEKLGTQFARVIDTLDAVRREPSRNGLELEQIDKRLRMIADRVDAAMGQNQGTSGVVAALESKLNAIGDRIEESLANAAGPDSVSIGAKLDAIGNQIRDGLARPSVAADAGASIEAKLDAIGDQIRDGLAQPSSAPDTSAIEARLEAIGRRLEIAPAAALSQGTLEIAILESKLSEISDRLEAGLSGGGGASAADFGALESRLSAMSEDIRTAVVESRPDTEAMERRIAALVDRMGRESGSGDTPAPALGAIERQLGELTAKFEDLHGTRDSDPAVLGAVSGQIAELGRRIDETRDQLRSFDAIESSLKDLFAKLDATQSGAVDAAREAARAAVAEASRSDSAGPVFDALQDRIAEIRAAADDSDRWTRETLASVHDTLRQLVQRMRAMEGAPAAHPPTSAADREAVVAPPVAPLAAASEAALEAASKPERERTNWTVPADTPSVPGAERGDPAPADAAMADQGEKKRRFALPSFRSTKAAAGETVAPDDGPARKTASPAVEAPAASTHARIRPSGNAKSASAPRMDGGQPDFIAAARRAAQAAARTSELQAQMDEEGGRDGTKSGHLSKYRKPLLFGGLALILAIGGMNLMRLMPSTPGDVSTADPAPAPSVSTAAATGGEPASQAAGASEGDGGATAAAPETPPAPVRQIDPSAGNEINLPPLDLANIETSPPEGEAGSPAAAAAPAPAGAADAATPASSAAELPEPAPTTPEDLLEGLPASRFSEGLRQAAANGDPVAQFAVAADYADSDGLASDMFRAAEWYARAAGQGLAPAQYRLGSLYEKGQGVSENLDMAQLWYERGAQAGNVKAMHNLAVILAGSENGAPDYDAAARWFMEASQYGLADSQYNLGILYARGLGVEQNIAESYKYFWLAAEQGDADAAAKRDQLAERLDEETLMAARLSLQGWHPKPVVAEANVVPMPEDGWGEPTVSARETAPASGVSADLSGAALIEETQRLLNANGYDAGTPDGLAGPRTEAAVRAFQRDAGMAATGTITPDLVNRLAARNS